MIARPRRRTYLQLAATAALATLASAAPAQAGRVLVSGYDADHHCGRTLGNEPQLCNMVRGFVTYARGGAPDPTKPVLIVGHSRNGFRGSPDTGAGVEYDRRTRTFTQAPRNVDWINAVNRAFPAGPIALSGAAPQGTVPYEVVDPQSGAFANASLTTARYSAILIASSRSDDDATDAFPQDLDGARSSEDSNAINRRKADFEAFYNEGGGILTGSGGSAARTSPGYYGFLPISAPGATYTAPFTLSPFGSSLGLTTEDANVQFPHIAFEGPAADANLKALSTDAAGSAIALIAETPRLSQVGERPATAGAIGGSIPGSTGSSGSSGGSNGSGRPSSTRRVSCRKSSTLRIVLNRPRGVAFVRAEVFIDGKRVKTVSRKRLGAGRKTKAFNVRLKRARKNNVRIQVRTSSGRRVTVKRTYTVCR